MAQTGRIVPKRCEPAFGVRPVVDGRRSAGTERPLLRSEKVTTKKVELRGLEPLTPCMPGRHSRYQLRHSHEATTQEVELRGLEPLTPCMPGRHSRYQL